MLKERISIFGRESAVNPAFDCEKFTTIFAGVKHNRFLPIYTLLVAKSGLFYLVFT